MGNRTCVLAQVAMWVEGRSATLSALADLVEGGLYGGQEDNAAITKNLILDVASRKYYGTLEGTVLLN